MLLNRRRHFLLPRRSETVDTRHSCRPAARAVGTPNVLSGTLDKPTRSSVTLDRRSWTTNERCRPRVKWKRDTLSGRASWIWAFCGPVAIINGRGIFSKRWIWPETLGDTGLHAHSLNRLGNWLLNTGQIAEVQVTHHEALALFEAQHGRPGWQKRSILLGTFFLHVGDEITAVQMYGRAIELLRAVDNRSVCPSC